MNNIAIIAENELAPLFGEKRRPAPILKGKDQLNALKDFGQNFETYTIAKGDVIRFPRFEDMIVKIQDVREAVPGEDRNRIPKVAYVACQLERNGATKNYWFNLNSLSRRDTNNKPVMPEWYELGNAEARLQKLAEYGAITCKETVDIDVTVFDGNRPKKKKTMGLDGVMHETNENETRKATVGIIVPLV